MKNMKSNIALISTGVGATLLYQNIKNGNLKKMVAKMKNTQMKAINKMEDMM